MTGGIARLEAKDEKATIIVYSACMVSLYREVCLWKEVYRYVYTSLKLFNNIGRMRAQRIA